MSGFDWFLACWWLFNIVVTVVGVGKTRKPTTPGAAAIATLIFLALIAGLFASRGVL